MSRARGARASKQVEKNMSKPVREATGRNQLPVLIGFAISVAANYELRSYETAKWEELELAELHIVVVLEGWRTFT